MGDIFYGTIHMAGRELSNVVGSEIPVFRLKIIHVLISVKPLEGQNSSSHINGVILGEVRSEYDQIHF